jgi:RalA-binding protein 1
VPRIVTTAAPIELGLPAEPLGNNRPSEQTYYDSDSSAADLPEDSRSLSVSTNQLPSESRSVSDPVVRQRAIQSQSQGSSPVMARPSGSLVGEATKAAPRTSSIDSAITAMTAKSKSKTRKSEQPTAPEMEDVATLIQSAGSAEAVIQYLLKDKQSQSQQNAQLWRLVDKQRAMILGQTKDLERALKDKEKYRKKLKEVLAAQGPTRPQLGSSAGHEEPVSDRRALNEATTTTERVLEAPISPALDSDSQKHSPIDVSMAPYPITPPADQPHIAPPSAVGEILDPSHVMPKAAEHAYDQFDHDAQEREADTARKEADAFKDIPINFALPPSRAFPSEPPRGPPPKLPNAPPPPAPASLDSSPKIDEGFSQFPPPPAPPPRKPPPAPLQLKNINQTSMLADDDAESESDYDDLLEVTEIHDSDKRGRRKTREEDDRDRALLAQKEAEIRSLSKKSKKSASEKGTPKIAVTEQSEAELSMSPRPQHIQIPPPGRDDGSGSLAAVLSGNSNFQPPPLLSPGLPSSPRPMAMGMSMGMSMTSPPMSPRGLGAFPAAPLSPRPPRQAIPLPPNTPMTSSTTAPAEALNLTSPKPLNIVKRAMEEQEAPPSPSKSHRDSPTERTRVFTGFKTEEYPDLLLPPNALPQIDVRVASSRMKPSRASLLSLTQLEEDPVFTLAIFSRMDGGELWRVEKDSMSLAKLDQRLKQSSNFIAKTPERSLFSGHAPAKLDARRVALDQYLDELLNTPLEVPMALELCKYLSTNTLPPNADETGGSSNESVFGLTMETGPGGRPFRNGYLTKKGKNFGGWKARFFVLDGPQLKYYETPGGAHLGTIKLQNAQIGKQSQARDTESPARSGQAADENDDQYRHAFLILEPKKKDPNSLTKHVLCAESDRERDLWVDALLRWIDFKGPDDIESAKKGQASGASERPSGMNAKKKMYGQMKQQLPPAESDDTLVSVSYEATKQGDIPHGAPPKDRVMGSQSSESQTSLGISAPRDMQVISDSAPWGSKLGMSLAPPAVDDKKAKKRSFFGFGPKARSSSDGQESLFGSDSGSNSTGQVGGEGRGPVRQVFGATLGEAVRFCPPVDVRVPLPSVVYRCIQYLDARNAVLEEGIFRLSGSNVVIKQLRERFNTEGDVNLLADTQYHDIHAVASLLKLYLRELPTTILTRDLHMEFLAVTEMTSGQDKMAALNELTQRLPQANATLLKYLIAFLIKIINHADQNKMTVRNVGIVFSPTLNIPAPVFALFLQNYEAIFGVEPEEYELPSPVEDREMTPSLRERRPSADTHARPSTSSTSASPHRQRLLEAVMEGHGQRTSSNPPPGVVNSMAQLSQLNQLRSTPTPPPPPPQQRQPVSYEPSYLAQQNQQTAPVSFRPAYESGFMAPSGYDAMQAPGMPAPRQQPGYDRPIYDTSGGAPYEQQYGGSKASRRESAVFMGNGLSHQGSRSRLGQETRF